MRRNPAFIGALPLARHIERNLGLCLFDLEYFSRLDSAWVGAYSNDLRLEAKIHSHKPAFCGNALAAFLSQRAIYSDRLTTSWLPKTRYPSMVRRAVAHVVRMDGSPAWHGFLIFNARHRAARIWTYHRLALCFRCRRAWKSWHLCWKIPALELMGLVIQPFRASCRISALRRSSQSAIHCVHQRILNIFYFLLHYDLRLRFIASRTGAAHFTGNCMKPLIVLRGGGDLASGVALRLHRAGFQIVIIELEQPLAVRRTVSFSEAVYEGAQTVEGVTARLVSPDQLQVALEAGEIPVIIDPNANILRNQFLTSPRSTFVIDARLLKTAPDPLDDNIPLHIGLGPGFCAGENCHAVIETRRSHTLGRVYWSGSAQADSGQPDGDPRRVLRALHDGIVTAHANIGDHLKEGQLIAEIQSKTENRKSKIAAPFKGILRGLIHPGIEVTTNMKIGDVDPRDDPVLCSLVSDKALAIGGGALEAVLSFTRKFE